MKKGYLIFSGSEPQDFKEIVDAYDVWEAIDIFYLKNTSQLMTIGRGYEDLDGYEIYDYEYSFFGISPEYNI